MFSEIGLSDTVHIADELGAVVRGLVALLILLAGLPPRAAAIQTDAPPLPERNPGRTGAPARQTPPPPGEVATIPWSDAEIAAAKAKWRPHGHSPLSRLT